MEEQETSVDVLEEDKRKGEKNSPFNLRIFKFYVKLFLGTEEKNRKRRKLC